MLPALWAGRLHRLTTMRLSQNRQTRIVAIVTANRRLGQAEVKVRDGTDRSFLADSFRSTIHLSARHGNCLDGNCLIGSPGTRQTESHPSRSGKSGENTSN